MILCALESKGRLIRLSERNYCFKIRLEKSIPPAKENSICKNRGDKQHISQDCKEFGIAEV